MYFIIKNKILEYVFTYPNIYYRTTKLSSEAVMFLYDTCQKEISKNSCSEED